MIEVVMCVWVNVGWESFMSDVVESIVVVCFSFYVQCCGKEFTLGDNKSQMSNCQMSDVEVVSTLLNTSLRSQ